MAAITKEMIQELRVKTNVGILDCRKALTEANGDMEQAVELLRKKGVAVAAKRSGNALENGAVDGAVNGDCAALAQVGCETDFSARTSDMKNFIQNVVQTATAGADASSVDALMEQQSTSGSLTLQACLDELVSKIAENIKVTNVAAYKTNASGVVNVYVHPDLSMAAMVELKADKELSSEQKEQLKPLARDVCMQIAVTNPLAISPEGIEQSVIDKEKEIAREQMSEKDLSKPEQIQEKILEGKLRKFFEEACLANQKFIKDDKLTVQQKLDAAGAGLTISRFERFGINR